MKSKIKFEKMKMWDHHYFGWHGAMEHMSKFETIDNPKLYQPAIEGTFVSSETGDDARVELYKNNPWVGTFHHPHDDFREWFNIFDVLRKDARKNDLMKCWKNLKGVFVVSSVQKEFYENLPEFENIPIEVLLHPTETRGDVFDYNLFKNNLKPQLIMVGDHLRSLKTFESLNTNFEKAIMLGHIDPTKEKKKSKYFEYQSVSDKKYDEILSKNIMFAQFTQVTASNLVVECIARATPLLVNPLPAVVEYMGKNYPLYFESAEEAQQKINDEKLIQKTHHFMKNHPNLGKLNIKYFEKSIFNSNLYKSL